MTNSTLELWTFKIVLNGRINNTISIFLWVQYNCLMESGMKRRQTHFLADWMNTYRNANNWSSSRVLLASPPQHYITASPWRFQSLLFQGRFISESRFRSCDFTLKQRRLQHFKIHFSFIVYGSPRFVSVLFSPDL